jgi:formylmethanofuran dehydrogenase subunit C
MSLILAWRDATRLTVDGAPLRPDLLADKPPRDVAATPLGVGNAPIALGDLFTVAPLDAPPGTLVVEGDLRGVAGLGAGMAAGRLIVRGDAGPRLGLRISGGRLDVHGHVGPWAGSEMRGGLLHIRGNAGDHLGSALPGSRLGLRDGLILVDGNAAARVGQSMRRGLIAVGGTLGPAAAHAMIAGSLFAFGAVGPNLGLGMRRGTVFLTEPIGSDRLLPTFLPSGIHAPPFLAIYLSRLAALGFGPAARRSPRVRRYNGDTSAGGQGEILVAVD